MNRDWIQSIGSILPEKARNRFVEQITELQESYDLRDSDYDELNRVFTSIFEEELEIDKEILFKYWIFDNDKVRIPISGGIVSLKLRTVTVNVCMSDGRYCLINVGVAAASYSNALYIRSAEAYINLVKGEK